MTGLERSAVSLSPAFCAHNGVLLLPSSDGEVCLGMLDIDDLPLRGRIEREWPGSRFSYSPLGRDEFALALSRLFAEDRAEGGDDGSGMTACDRRDGGSAIDRVERDAPIVNLLNSIFLEASSLGASDIHLESEASHVAVRYRVDGRLRTMARLSPDRGDALSTRLKHLANLNIVERRRPQDGRLNVAGAGRALDVRVSFAPTVRGESVVLRLLDSGNAALDLDSLGYSTRELARLRGAVASGSGLVLVSGPTGSGKTTTLSAILRELASDELKIVSIEDPVEYRLAGVTQIQTDEGLALTFESLLRRVFRQDPDVVMIGEIRDGQTARLAARAALTGHLVFATVHATGALEAIPRLMDLGVEPYLVAATLRLSVAQRLLRRRCAPCGGTGCPACGGTGYAGRVAVSESFGIDRDARGAIESARPAERLEALARRGGFRTMREDAAEKIRAGITDEGEARREIGP